MHHKMAILLFWIGLGIRNLDIMIKKYEINAHISDLINL